MCAKCMPGRIAPWRSKQNGPRKHQQSRLRWIGTCGSGPLPCVPIIPRIIRARGGPGGISARVPWATSAASVSTRSLLGPQSWKHALTSEGCISTFWQGLWVKTDPKNKEQYPRSTVSLPLQASCPRRVPAEKSELQPGGDGGMMPPRPPCARRGPPDGRQRRWRPLCQRPGQPDVRLPRPTVHGSRPEPSDTKPSWQEPSQIAGPRSRRRREDTSAIGCGAREGGEPGQLELRLFRAPVGNRAHGEPGSAVSPTENCFGTARRWRRPNDAEANAYVRRHWHLDCKL